MSYNDILSRRDFLKLSGAGLLGLFLAQLLPDPALALGSNPEQSASSSRGTGSLEGQAAAEIQGRVAYTQATAYDVPSRDGKKVRTYKRDTLLTVTEQIVGGSEAEANRLWYHLGEGGYIHTGGIQPVQTVLNKVNTDLPAAGVIGEITVPYADSWWAINRDPFPGPRLYYASTHWISAVVTDQRDGSLWYKAFDHLYNAYYYVRPEYIHILTAGEIAPLSPDISQEHKHIALCLDRQLVLAFEDETLVFMARTATGAKGFETPVGSFTTFHKRPTAHMVGGDGVASLYDLAGVPWDTYITENGISFHGTFWHNDYGAPRSHGCINLRPQDARWLYRWTQPPLPTGQRYIYEPGAGTRVEIVQSYTPSLKRKTQ